MAVTNCNIDMEGLIADPNRSIATLAITTLLKTGNEGSVERLMKQIQNFLNEIQDENKARLLHERHKQQDVVCFSLCAPLGPPPPCRSQLARRRR